MIGLVSESVSIEPPAPRLTTTIEPSTPTLKPVESLERGERVLGHEHDDDGLRLGPELKAERGRDDVVIAAGLALHDEHALAVRPADAEARLVHRGEHQPPRRLAGELAPGARVFLVEALKRLVGGGVDLVPVPAALGPTPPTSATRARPRIIPDRCFMRRLSSNAPPRSKCPLTAPHPGRSLGAGLPL